MKVYTNSKHVKQKQKIGLFFSLVGMVVMFVALIVAWQNENPTLAWGIILAGVIIASVGTYHVNRWVRPPLPENALAQSFQKMDARWVLFNHYGLVPHLLLTPKGLVAIKAKRYEGPVRYEPETDRWRGKFSWRRFYGHGLTAETIGDPAEEVTKQRNDVLAWLQVHLPDLADEVPVEGIAYFVNPRTELHADQPPVPLADSNSVKKIVQKALADHNPLSKDTYWRLRKKLEAEVIDGDEEAAE